MKPKKSKQQDWFWWQLAVVLALLLPFMAAAMLWLAKQSQPATGAGPATLTDLNMTALTILIEGLTRIATLGMVVCVTGLLVLPVVIYTLKYKENNE